MPKHPYQLFSRKSLKSMVIVLCSTVTAFIVGIKTAGDIEPVVEGTKADSNLRIGDIDGNDRVDLIDVKIAMDIVSGKVKARPEQLLADPNQDFRLTQTDIEILIEMIQKQP